MYMCMPTWACEYVATCTFYCIIVACLSDTADEGRPEMAGIMKYYFNESILEFNPELQVIWTMNKYNSYIIFLNFYLSLSMKNAIIEEMKKFERLL